MTPKNTDKNGLEVRDDKGRFLDGNAGKPKGAVNKNTKDLKEFIINFLNDKSFEIPIIWESLEDKDRATLYLHLLKIVIPKPIDETIDEVTKSEEYESKVNEILDRLRNNSSE
jgi:hypothetical protein